MGYLSVLEQKYSVPNGETKINIKTMVFHKGIEFIRKKDWRVINLSILLI